MKDGKAVEFLLAPTVGACIHTPSPPANQMVHVNYPKGFPAQQLYVPVWIAGELVSRALTRSVQYSDGGADVQVSDMMQADAVELF